MISSGVPVSFHQPVTAVVINVNDAPRGLLRLVGSHIEDSVLSLSNTITDDDGLGALAVDETCETTAARTEGTTLT